MPDATGGSSDLQEAGDFAAADELIARLGERSLLGHVLWQRYMHPTAYRSSFAELAGWLEHYADHPGADRIYSLALRRRPAGAAAPARPVRGYLAGAGQEGSELVRIDYRTALVRSPADEAAVLAWRNRDRAAGRRWPDRRGRGPAAATRRSGPWSTRSRPISPAGPWRAAISAPATMPRPWRSPGAPPPAPAASCRRSTGSPGSAPGTWPGSSSRGGISRPSPTRPRRRRPSARGRPSGRRGPIWSTFRPQLVSRYPAAGRRRRATSMACWRVRRSASARPRRRPRPTSRTRRAEVLLRFAGARRALALGQVGELERAEQEIRKLAGRASPELMVGLIALADVARPAGRADAARPEPALERGRLPFRRPLPGAELAAGRRLHDRPRADLRDHARRIGLRPDAPRATPARAA